MSGFTPGFGTNPRLQRPVLSGSKGWRRNEKLSWRKDWPVVLALWSQKICCQTHLKHPVYLFEPAPLSHSAACLTHHVAEARSASKESAKTPPGHFRVSGEGGSDDMAQYHFSHSSDDFICFPVVSKVPRLKFPHVRLWLLLRKTLSCHDVRFPWNWPASDHLLGVVCHSRRLEYLEDHPVHVLQTKSARLWALVRLTPWAWRWVGTLHFEIVGSNASTNWPLPIRYSTLKENTYHFYPLFIFHVWPGMSICHWLSLFFWYHFPKPSNTFL